MLSLIINKIHPILPEYPVFAIFHNKSSFGFWPRYSGEVSPETPQRKYNSRKCYLVSVTRYSGEVSPETPHYHPHLSSPF